MSANETANRVNRLMATVTSVVFVKLRQSSRVHIIAIAAVVLSMLGMAHAQSVRKLVETKDHYHITVIGGGYLQAENKNHRCYLVNSCVLFEDAEGRLCTRAHDEVLILVPTIHVPKDSVSLLIHPNGKVSSIIRGQADSCVAIGTFSVALVNEHNPLLKAIAPGVFETDASIKPSVKEFGESSRTTLLEGIVDADVFKASRTPSVPSTDPCHK